MAKKINYWGLELWNPSKEEIGFIYEIHNKALGLKYAGMKRFWSNKTIGGVKTVVESDWRRYKGSSNETKDWNAEDCEFKMVKICYSLFELSYSEIAYLIEYDCLLRDDYVNWCLGSHMIGRVPKYMIMELK
ncbi:hypothetical protein E4185_16830 [Aeromonas media]|uniref:hypothetical protein n=1 Tax=Aeromonas media TaxID=651 RepID=UPI00148B0F23|nr:hypothetical protein [Aeromonas media]QJT27564.1 hypothetical protein E4185_16830 [Aeromonas media]